MSFKDFKVIETIGKGSFASVYKVLRKSDNKVYALKRVKISKMSKREVSDALNEIRFLASIRQKNIVGFLEAFLENNDTELCIIMEYCGCGDLSQKVERYKRRKTYIDEKVIWRYLIQALKALEHLHEKGICHRDLKTANTFLSEDGSIKIGDMNVSKRLKKGGQLQTQIGTPYYMPPEIWNNKPYNSTCDIWSLGCMIYELCSLRPPFLGDSFPSLKRAISLGRYPSIPRVYTDSLSQVIAMMLKLSPRERPSASDLLRSPFVAAKLGLDETSTSFGKEKNKKDLNLLNTIKVPQNLNKLNLPKPCYPDIRPNSPTSWTVAEQKDFLSKKVPPLPPVGLNSIAESNKENTPFPSARSEVSDCSNISKNAPNPIYPPTKDDNGKRRPLAPVSERSNRPNIVKHHSKDYINLAKNNKKDLNHILNPIPPSMRKDYQPRAPHQPAGYPSRLQYHNRMW